MEVDQQDDIQKIPGDIPPITEESTTSVPSKPVVEDKNRASLIRQLKTFISNPRSQKYCEHLAEVNLSSLSTEELKEMLEDIHNSMLSSSAYGIIETAVKAGIPAIEVYSASHQAFPLRLEGLSQALELSNPDSVVNNALFCLDVQLGAGMRLNPLQTLGAKIGLAVFACHSQNKLAQGVKADLNKKVDNKIIDEIDKLP